MGEEREESEENKKSDTLPPPSENLVEGPDGKYRPFFPPSWV
jgi:hypothetical protein